MVEADGWRNTRTNGSHLHYEHPTKPGLVTIPVGGKMNNVVPPGTKGSVLRQAGLK